MTVSFDKTGADMSSACEIQQNDGQNIVNMNAKAPQTAFSRNWSVISKFWIDESQTFNFGLWYKSLSNNVYLLKFTIPISLI